ncbi:hypothetical protein [Streptomyces sp. NPDC050264]|uniref:hypothetical protein n=1 Tax=Streptomyces sp. NPDC050264 TaxID=3155038 RepID=UPI00343F63E4
MRDTEAVTVDALGMTCPQPVIELGRVRVSGTLTVLAAETRPDGAAAYAVRRTS